VIKIEGCLWVPEYKCRRCAKVFDDDKNATQSENKAMKIIGKAIASASFEPRSSKRYVFLHYHVCEDGSKGAGEFIGLRCEEKWPSPTRGEEHKEG